MVAALIVGGLTAWYLGLRAGGVAAAATAVALLVAAFVPAAAVPVYALLLAWVAVLYFVGPRLADGPTGTNRFFGGVSTALGHVQREFKRWKSPRKG